MFNLIFTESVYIQYLYILFSSVCIIGIPLRIMGIVPTKLRWEAHLFTWFMVTGLSLGLYYVAYIS